MSVRAAAPDDAAAIHELRREFYRETASPWDEQAAWRALAALLAEPERGRVWLLAAERPVGFLVLTLGYSLEFRRRDAFIDELYLAPAYRGRGLGRQALALAEDAARALKVQALHLEVESGNDAALSLYRRQGFADHERRLMTKWLAPAPAGWPRGDAER